LSRAGRPAIVWFRQDLRLADNPALTAAAEAGPVIALYVLDEEAPGRWTLGGASRWWLHHGLEQLGAALADMDVRLVLRRGPAARIVPEMAVSTGAGTVFWNRRYEPHAVVEETAINAALAQARITAKSFNGALLTEPWTIKNKSGGPFRVFTPFWSALKDTFRPPTLLSPPELHSYGNVESERLEDWQLRPTKPDWAAGLRECWEPGEGGAQGALERFLTGALGRYASDRDKPTAGAVSRLSPYLHWGEISVRQVWRAADAQGGPAAEPFLRELAWREFSCHLLWQFPELPDKPFDRRFTGFPWRDDPAALKAWQRGETGYPLIDAGMRQLWITGWMHNRVRMVAASFLTKHLLLPWTAGAAWFWDTLVDADLANNAANWQWVAGCGADAAPYFRIFNPVLQGEKFDPEGTYVRRFVPELANLPNKFIHRPWSAPADVLAKAGIVLGTTYPMPIVDHDAARTRALAAFKTISG
jgi:deoxyribodipyrimidine photo-lyase